MRNRHPLLRSPVWTIMLRLVRRVYGPMAHCYLYEWEPQGWYTVYVVIDNENPGDTLAGGVFGWSARSSRPTAAEAAGVLLDEMQRRLGIVL